MLAFYYVIILFTIGFILVDFDLFLRKKYAWFKSSSALHFPSSYFVVDVRWLLFIRPISVRDSRKSTKKIFNYVFHILAVISRNANKYHTDHHYKKNIISRKKLVIIKNRETRNKTSTSLQASWSKELPTFSIILRKRFWPWEIIISAKELKFGFISSVKTKISDVP